MYYFLGHFVLVVGIFILDFLFVYYDKYIVFCYCIFNCIFSFNCVLYVINLGFFIKYIGDSINACAGSIYI